MLRPYVQPMAALSRTRFGPQFYVGEKFQFRDLRTGAEKTEVSEDSIPSGLRYFFPDLWKSSKPLLCLDMDLTLV